MSLPPINDSMIKILQDIRRANHSMQACAQILIADTLNRDKCPDESGYLLRLRSDMDLGLANAIDICSTNIQEQFENDLELLGVMWGYDWEEVLERRDREWSDHQIAGIAANLRKGHDA